VGLDESIRGWFKWDWRGRLRVGLSGRGGWRGKPSFALVGRVILVATGTRRVRVTYSLNF